MKENGDKPEENKVRNGQNLCGEENVCTTKVKENELGRKMLEAEEGKEGRIETEVDQCQVITDSNKEEYGEHADKEILKENVDK